MKKRMLAVMLAALLSLSLLAGCKPSDEPDDTTTTTTTAQGETDPSGEEETDPSGDDATDPSDEETDPSEEETIVTDEDGKTQATKKTNRTISGKKTTTKKVTTTTKKGDTTKKNTTTTKAGNTPGVDNTPSSDLSMPFEKTMKWTLFMTEHAYQPIKTDTIKFDAVYELTNVELDVDVGESGSAQTKLMAAAASGKMYDITFITNTQFRTYKTSLFYDLTDRIKTDTPHYYAAIKDEWNDLMTFATGGRLYGFAQTEYKYLYDEQGVLMPFIRADIFENNNLKKPTTWKEWFESMKLLKKKYPDSQPYASRGTDTILRYWTKMLGQAYHIYYNVEAAKWECGVLNAATFKNILQFMKDCYDEGILDQNFDQSSEKNFQDLATASKTFCTIDSGSPTAKADEVLMKTDKNARFYAINPLASHLNGGKTTTWYWPQSSNYQSMYYISSQAANLDELLFFMDWCYTDEGANTNNYGKKGVTYELDKDGMAYVPEKVWKQKWPEGSSRVYDWMSEFGLNQLCFAPYMNNQDHRWENYDWYPEEEYDHPWICDSNAEYKKGYASAQLNVSPDVSTELTARYDTLQAYIRNQIVGFIKGTREMSEYDVFVNDLKSMGIQELLDACNA